MIKKRNRDGLDVGHYGPVKVEKGVNETILPLKEGMIFWTVELGNRSSFDVERQEDAEILSRLVRIEKKIDKVLRKND